MNNYIFTAVKFSFFFKKKYALYLMTIFLFPDSGGLFVQHSGTIGAIVEEGIMGNIYVKLFEIWISGLGDVV